MRTRLRLVALTALLLSGFAQAADSLTIDVHRDANCGCCKDWIKHMESNGFSVNDHVEANMGKVKQELGVPPHLGSCHTAVINGQFIEGHVPAAQVLALKERPDLLGIAVPGMPVGSPGMEYDDRQDPYQVVGLTKEGELEVVAEYPGN